MLSFFDKLKLRFEYPAYALRKPLKLCAMNSTSLLKLVFWLLIIASLGLVGLGIINFGQQQLEFIREEARGALVSAEAEYALAKNRMDIAIELAAVDAIPAQKAREAAYKTKIAEGALITHRARLARLYW